MSLQTTQKYTKYTKYTKHLVSNLRREAVLLSRVLKAGVRKLQLMFMQEPKPSTSRLKEITSGWEGGTSHQHVWVLLTVFTVLMIFNTGVVIMIIKMKVHHHKITQTKSFISKNERT